VALSLAYQGLSILLIALIGWMLSLPIPLHYYLAFVPAIALATMIPISVGGLGAVQVAYVYFFGLAGIEPASALTVSLVIVAVGLLLGAAGAGVLIYDQGVGKPARTS
jgi:uncharacterized membrane protein YbhN (UPF0104 family)